MEDDLKTLAHQRGTIKGRLTKFENYIKIIQQIAPKNLAKLQVSELQFKLNKIEILFNTFDEIQTKIEKLTVRVDDELDERDKIETSFSTLTSIANEIIASASNKFHSSNSLDGMASACDINGDTSVSHVRLPTISLPKFDGNHLQWLEFRDTFESLIHQNKSIPAINKFHYLKSSLDAGAAVVIKSIECTSENYQIAWNLLNERYNNKRLLINNHLKSLLNFDHITKESYKSLRYLIDHISKNLRALSALEEPTEHWDTIIIFMMSLKLDSATGLKWEEYKGTLSHSANLEDFYSFLRNRADVLETVHFSRNDTKTEYKKSCNKHVTSLVSSATDNNNNSSYQCILCKQGHRLYECPKLKSMTPESRISEITKLKLCSNCLRPGHQRFNCKMGNCRICGRKHNTLLHIQNYNNNKTNTTEENELQKTSAHMQQTTNTNLQRNNNTKILQTNTTTSINYLLDPVSLSAAMPSQVLLSTALVEVVNPTTNKTYQARALLDSGSQSSLLTEKLKGKFNLITKSNTVAITGINNGTINATQSCELQIKSRVAAFSINVSCVVIPQITGNLPSIKIDPLQLNLPANILLADPEFYRPSEVDILLGADVFWELLNTTDPIKLGRNKPTLRDTKLGWVVAGPMGGSSTNSNSRTSTTHCNFSQEIHNSMTRFWELEEIPSTKKLLSTDEQFCETHFTKTTTRLSDGRFCVNIPLREDPEEALGDSYHIAKRRFLNLEHRLSRSPQTKQTYKEFINEYRDLGHLTEIERPAFGNYIPHHAVIREQSETTKLRVVFDGSCRTSSGKSFNDIQVVGPTVQDDLISILIRFRQNPYAVSGDIEKMYRQVMVHPSQRNLQLILWRDDEAKPLKTMSLKTVTYGTASAPYLSTRCLLQLAEECTDSTISDVIKHNFYVDDCLLTAKSASELKVIITGVTQELRKGGFSLRKFRTNCPEIFDDCNILTMKDNHEFSKQSSVLGLIWSPSQDTLKFSTNIVIPDVTTKRNILSTASQIFDPLGLLSASIIIPKMLLQKLWLTKLDWDEPVPDQIENDWKEFAKNINILATIHIPRYISLHSSSIMDIHIFVDSSSKAYSACLFIKSTDNTGKSKVNLLCAKTKVAPVKPTTIPRLELCAALLGAKLHTKVVESLDIQIRTSTFWSDSYIVLGWIKTQPKTLKQFVCNRVQEIRDLTPQNAWRWVPTDMNPADLATRGVQPQHLPNADLWWTGPKFLLQSDDDWPPNTIPDVVLPEIKTNVTTTNSECLINFYKYSKLYKIQRILAYALRFINNIKSKNNKIKDTILTLDELQTSLTTLAKLSQKDSFPTEIQMLASNHSLPSKSHILALNPYLDSHGVLRVGGRIQSGPHYTIDKKHPILIDSKHHFTRLLFEREHVRLLHCGPQLLLSSVREQFWPTGGRDIARKTVSKCVVCIRMRGKTVQPIMGNLPQPRVTPAPPFETCGLDFGGPFYISSRKGRGARTSKCYLCLFVCFSSKSLHLEVSSDLSTNAFILCLRRFIARRSKPQTIFCDNGTNFVGANNELKRMLRACRQPVTEFANEEGIMFKFNPAYSPNFSGIVEAGIKSAKYLLRKIVGNTSLTFEEITTLFCQIEAILNSRPLTPLSSDPSDLSPLTPGHFLVGRPLVSLPSPTTAKISVNRYQLIERLRQTFWNRWTREYICELQQRVKWRTKGQQLKYGDLVILKEDHLPPMKWHLGRIVKTYAGSDGVCRVVDVQTNKSVLRRAVSRLCPLPNPESYS